MGTLKQDLLRLGVRPGGVLLVHSSLRALGRPPGGAAGVIDELLSILGPEGTLLMPALTYERVTPENPVFDVRQTPSNVGVLAEVFRQQPGTRRSLHPTHSVCAVGRLAANLLKPHAADSTPCGPNSPFRRLAELDGQILMLGCGLEPNTSMHAVEEVAAVPYLFDPPIEYRLTLEDGSTRRKTYLPHSFRGFYQRYERLERLLSAPAMKSGPALAGQAHLLEAAALWPAALRALGRDPLYFVEAF